MSQTTPRWIIRHEKQTKHILNAEGPPTAGMATSFPSGNWHQKIDAEAFAWQSAQANDPPRQNRFYPESDI